jgi:outer membrane protein, multidrug efflux system
MLKNKSCQRKALELMMPKAKWILFLLLFMAGCLKPIYDPAPTINVPDNWRMNVDESSTLCNLSWWEQFHDPVLNEMILTALKNNQDLQVAINRVIEFYDILKVVSSQLFPFVTGNASYNRYETSLAVPTALPPAFRRFNVYEGFVNLSWELDFWGRVRSAADAAYSDYLSEVEARRAVVITVVSSVANAYIALRGLDAQLEVSKKTLDSRLYSLKLAKDRFMLGETSELEVVQAAAELEIAALTVIQLERDIPIQENLLSVLLGEFPHNIERGSQIAMFQYPVDIPMGLPVDLLIQRPDIMEAEDKLLAANERVSEARALFFPQFTLTGMFGNESSELHKFLTSPAEMWQYGVAAVQTLFDAGRIYYTYQGSKAVREEAYFSYYRTILNALADVENALVAYSKDRELVVEHERQVTILNRYLQLATLRYNEGEVDYLNVLDAERTLFDAQLSLVQAQVDSFQAVVQLYSALGGGWVEEADDYALDNVACEKTEN